MPDTDPLRAALAHGLCLAVSNGHPEPAERSFRLIFSFHTLEAMQRAHEAYVAPPSVAECQTAEGCGQFSDCFHASRCVHLTNEKPAIVPTKIDWGEEEEESDA